MHCLYDYNYSQIFLSNHHNNNWCYIFVQGESSFTRSSFTKVIGDFYPRIFTRKADRGCIIIQHKCENVNNKYILWLRLRWHKWRRRHSRLAAANDTADIFLPQPIDPLTKKILIKICHTQNPCWRSKSKSVQPQFIHFGCKSISKIIRH